MCVLGVRHEAAQQVRNDQEVRLCIFLGGARYHGSRKLGVDHPAALCLPRCQIPLHGHGLHARLV